VRTSLFFLLLLPFPVMAGWTGLGAFIGQGDSDWLFSQGVQNADIGYYGLRIEENTEAEIRVGVSAGQFDLRLQDRDAAIAEKYNGQFLSFYLRWPVMLTRSLKFHTLLSYRYNLGTKVKSEITEINWSEISLDMGVSLQLGRLSLRPYLNVRRIDGDITSDTSTLLFELDTATSYGLKLDYHVERTAYIRLQGSSGSHNLMMVSFVREY